MGTILIAQNPERRLPICDTCDRHRIGKGAIGWPRGDEICPVCRAVLERAEAAGIVTALETVQ